MSPKPGAFFDSLTETLLVGALTELLIVSGIVAARTPAVNVADFIFIAAIGLSELNLILFFHFTMPYACEPLSSRMVSLALAIYLFAMNVMVMLPSMLAYRFFWIIGMTALVAWKNRTLVKRFKGSEVWAELRLWYANVLWTMAAVIIVATGFYFLVDPRRRVTLFELIIETRPLRFLPRYEICVPGMFYVLYLGVAFRTFWRNADKFFKSGEAWAKSLQDCCSGAHP